MITASLILPRTGLSSSNGIYGYSEINFDCYIYSNSGFLMTGSGIQTFKWPKLRAITTGSLFIRGNDLLSTLQTPLVSAICGSFHLSGSPGLTAVSFPSLSVIGGNFSIEGNDTLALTASSFPRFSYVGGNINFLQNAAIDALTINSLLSMSVGLNGGTWANTLTITGSNVDAATFDGKTYMDTLHTRGATLIVPVTGSDIPALDYVTMSFNNKDFDADNSSSIGGITFPSLTTTSTGMFSITRFSSMNYLDIPVLANVSAFPSTATFRITGSALTQLTMSALNQLGIISSNGTLSVAKNTSLVAIAIPASITNLGAVDFSGNALNQTTIDAIISMLVASNSSTWASTANLAGGTNSAPGAGSVGNLVTLAGRGATVTTN